MQPNVHRQADADGQFRRKDSVFRSYISPDPDATYPAAKDRYALYINLGCPWAHRVNLVRSLKGLEDIIQLIVCDFELTDNGWLFTGQNGSMPADPLYGFTQLKQLYEKAQSDYSGRYTVPVLWDKHTQQIVNNESSEIIRILYTAFDALLPPELREPSFPLYPSHLQSSIDEMNDWVYNTVNNGVYKTGFATTQAAYDGNVTALFSSLDRLETHLTTQKDGPFLFGLTVTEADIRLYTTLIRFDGAYYPLFLCNIKSIRHDYPYLHRWLKMLYWNKGGVRNGEAFGRTVDFRAYKVGYLKARLKAQSKYAMSTDDIVVPKGPVPDLEAWTEEDEAWVKGRK